MKLKLEGGNKVLLTGDFVEWNTYFELKKDELSDSFSITLALPQKQIQFKFIVDGQWKCSSNYQIVSDNNHNLNNHIAL